MHAQKTQLLGTGRAFRLYFGPRCPPTAAPPQPHRPTAAADLVRERFSARRASARLGASRNKPLLVTASSLFPAKGSKDDVERREAKPFRSTRRRQAVAGRERMQRQEFVLAGHFFVIS